jgi:hypothetical protein
MPVVETDNDAAGDYLQSGVTTFSFLVPGASDQNLTEIMKFAFVTII